MTRAVTPAVGLPLLVGITVFLSASLGVVAFDVSLPDQNQPIVIAVTATATDGRITVAHESGPPIDVREISVRVEIEGTPLTYQPPVPFFAAKGFHGGPTGPFNSAAGPRFGAGETASFRVAATNSPSMTEGDSLTVRMSRGEIRIASATTRIR